MSIRHDRHPQRSERGVQNRSHPRPPENPKHPEQIEPTWPTADGEMAVSEAASGRQGALSPFGDDVSLPLPLERHGRKWTVREVGSERHDADY